MSDEPENLVLRLLQEIRSDLADVKRAQIEHSSQFGQIKETLRLHSMRLDTYSENFRDIIALLRDMNVAAELRHIKARLSALEPTSNQ